MLRCVPQHVVGRATLRHIATRPLRYTAKCAVASLGSWCSRCRCVRCGRPTPTWFGYTQLCCSSATRIATWSDTPVEGLCHPPLCHCAVPLRAAPLHRRRSLAAALCVRLSLCGCLSSRTPTPAAHALSSTVSERSPPFVRRPRRSCQRLCIAHRCTDSCCRLQRCGGDCTSAWRSLPATVRSARMAQPKSQTVRCVGWRQVA